MKVPLAFLAGWAMRNSVWDRVRAALPEGYCEVVLREGAEARLEARADSLATQLAAPTWLCAWSHGAMVALSLAARHPQCVAGLTLVAATPRFVAAPGWPHGLSPQSMQDFTDGYARDPQRTLRRFLTLQTLRDAPAQRFATAAALTDMLVPAHTPGLAEGLQQLATSDLRPLLPSLTQPVRLLHGEADMLVPPGASRALAQALPKSTLTSFPGCGHALPLLQPDAIARALTADA